VFEVGPEPPNGIQGIDALNRLLLTERHIRALTTNRGLMPDMPSAFFFSFQA